jgi:ankyrin repeat protein
MRAGTHDRGRNALRRLLKARDPASISELSQMLCENRVDLVGLVESGKTPLHLAAWRGAPGVVSLLLSHSADIDAVSTGPNNYGKTALFYAITRCRDDVVKVLLSAGYFR